MEPVTQAMAIRTVMDQATLDAFVDGALSPEDAARVVLHLADHPGDQAYVDAVMETNALLAAAYGAPLHQALPERLRATLFPAGTTAMAARRPGRRALPTRAVWGGALAASAALAVGLAAGFGPWRGPTGGLIAGMPGAEAELHAALETLPTGTEPVSAGGATISMVGTYRDGEGRFCREFELLDPAAAARTQGIACRDDAGGWTTEIVVASRLAATEAAEAGFTPASGPSDAVTGALDRLGAGGALPYEEEQALIANWAN